MSPRPLTGVKVIDFCWVGAGSYTTRILGDLGADVIKIESSKRLDQIRMSAPFKDRIPGVNRSGYFADRNAGKRSVTINLKEPQGKELALELIESADVVANNFSPGTMDRLGLGYDVVRTRRPDVIFLEMSMQGADGPHSRQLGYGLTIGAVAGLQYLVGEPGRPPTGTGTNYPDHVPSPGHAAFAVLAAVRHRRRTGEGQYIDLAQTEATVAILGQHLLAESVGIHQRTAANEQPETILHDAFRCADAERWIAISLDTPAEWERLLELLSLPQVLEANCVTSESQVDRATVRHWIETRTREWDAYELMARLQQAGLRAGVVQTAREVVDQDPQLRHRGHWARLPHPEIEECLYNVLPIRFSGMEVAPAFGAPCLGEHTEEVLAAAGLSVDEIEELAAAGVLE